MVSYRSFESVNNKEQDFEWCPQTWCSGFPFQHGVLSQENCLSCQGWGGNSAPEQPPVSSVALTPLCQQRPGPFDEHPIRGRYVLVSFGKTHHVWLSCSLLARWWAAELLKAPMQAQ